MSSTFSVTIRSGVDAVETLTGADLSAPTVINHSGFNESTTPIDSTTTPDVTECAFDTIALSAGAGTIDLTSIKLNGVAVSLSGLKVRALKIKNTGTNPITVSKGATNGYTGLGAAFSVTLQAGQSFLWDGGTDGTAVSPTVKTLDLAGTGTDTVQVSAAAGPT